MKHTFKTLLGLVLVVFVLVGCSSPVGSEFSEIDETLVVETPEDKARLVNVEFRWGSLPDIGDSVGSFETCAPRYLLDLHFDPEWNSLVYGYPEGYDSNYYKELIDGEIITKSYEEGTPVSLKKWTSRAIRLTSKGADSKYRDCLRFSIKDIYDSESYKDREFFEEFVVGNEDMIIYVFFDAKRSK